MMTHFQKGDLVAFSCHIFGDVSGTIKRFIRCLSNGQQHAIVEIRLPDSSTFECTEPVINLRST